MNSLAATPRPPHFHEHTRLSPTRSMTTSTSSSRKRKASPTSDDDHDMSTSPAITNARLPGTLNRKRLRPNLAGRALTVDRLLETLDKDALRTIISTLCNANSALKDQVVQISPRPSIDSTVQVLRQYYNRLMESFPLDPNPRSDYCFDRVRPQWLGLLDSLADFTPHFLPPNEQQATVSLQYLDAVTNIIHDLPEWDSAQHNFAKQNAYEEISKAWVTVINEASKRGGGMHLQYSGWDEKLNSHNNRSGGLMREACDELGVVLGWLKSETQPQSQQQQNTRQQLLAGTYGMDQPSLRTGMW